MNFPIPKGSFALPMTQVRTMVSLSREFQKETNSDTATDALKHIGFTRFSEDERTRPFAIVLLGGTHGFEQESGGDGNFLVPFGNLGLLIERDTNPLYKFDEDSASIDAMNFFGTVAGEVAALSGKDTHLPIALIQLTQFGDSRDEDTESIGDFFYAAYEVIWGIRS